MRGRLVLFILLVFVTIMSVNAALVNVSQFKSFAKVQVDSPTTLGDHPIEVLLDSQTLILDRDLDENCSNIQVTSSDRVTLLNSFVDKITTKTETLYKPYYYRVGQLIASSQPTAGCGSQSLSVWFKANLTAGPNTFYIYYGNASIDQPSSGDSVFSYFNSSVYTTASSFSNTNDSALSSIQLAGLPTSTPWKVSYQLLETQSGWGVEYGSSNFTLNGTTQDFGRRPVRLFKEFDYEANTDINFSVWMPYLYTYRYPVIEKVQPIGNIQVVYLSVTPYFTTYSCTYSNGAVYLAGGTNRCRTTNGGSVLVEEVGRRTAFPTYSQQVFLTTGYTCPSGYDGSKVTTYPRQIYHWANNGPVTTYEYSGLCERTVYKFAFARGQRNVNITNLKVHPEVSGLNVTKFNDATVAESELLVANTSAPQTTGARFGYSEPLILYANVVSPNGTVYPSTSCDIELYNNGTKYSMDFDGQTHNYTLTAGVTNYSTAVRVNCSDGVTAIPNITTSIYAEKPSTYTCGQMIERIQYKKDIKLENNIDCSATTFPDYWTGESNLISSYDGEFDGNSKTITGFSLTNTQGNNTVALIPELSGSIKDLTLTQSSVVAPQSEYVGLLVGKSTGEIENVIINGTVQGLENVGLLAGRSEGEIFKIRIYGNAIGNQTVGTVAGFVKNNGGSYITSTANVRGNHTVGGFYGTSTASYSVRNFPRTLSVEFGSTWIPRTKFANHEFFGTVNASDAEYVGGFIGKMVKSRFFESSNQGTIIANNSRFVGGIAGEFRYSQMFDSYSTVNSSVTNSDSVGGIGGKGDYTFYEIKREEGYIVNLKVTTQTAKSNLYLQRVYSAMNMSSGGNTNVGLAFGNTTGAATFSFSYFLDDTASIDMISGEGTNTAATRTTTQMETPSNYQLWDFTNTWGITGAFPFFRSYLDTIDSTKVNASVDFRVEDQTTNISKLLGTSFDVFAETDAPEKTTFVGNKHHVRVYDPHRVKVYDSFTDLTVTKVLLEKVGNYTVEMFFESNSRVNGVNKTYYVDSKFPFTVPSGEIANVPNCTFMKQMILANKNINLTAEIDCTGVDFDGWSNSTLGFTNPYNKSMTGNGFLIKNLYINSPNNDNVALVPVAGVGGSIENVYFRNVTVIGKDNVGVVVGRVASGTSESDYIAKDVSIQESTINGQTNVGTLGGQLTGYGDRIYIRSTVNGTENVGGFVGKIQTGAIRNTRINSSVTGINNVGGIAGLVDKGTGTYSIFMGDINGTTNVGGLVGAISTELTIPDKLPNPDDLNSKEESEVNKIKSSLEGMYYAKGTFYAESANADIKLVGNVDQDLLDAAEEFDIEVITSNTKKFYNGMNDTALKTKSFFRADDYDFEETWAQRDGITIPTLCALSYNAQTGADDCTNAGFTVSDFETGGTVVGYDQISTVGISSLTVEVNGDTNNNIAFYSGPETVSIRDGAMEIFTFEYNFADGNLDMSDVSVTSLNDIVFVSNLKVLPDVITIYTEINDSDYLCVADKEVTSAEDISSSCEGEDEFLFSKEECLSGQAEKVKVGSESTIRCRLDENENYVVSGLEHSAAKASEPTLFTNHEVTGSGAEDQDIIVIADFRTNFEKDMITGGTCNATIEGESLINLIEGTEDYRGTLVGGKSTNGSYEANITCGLAGEGEFNVTEILYVGLVDEDFDTIDDREDNLIGNISDVTTSGITTPVLFVNTENSQAATLNGTYTGFKQVQFRDGLSNEVVSFLYDFDSNVLDLREVEINVTSTGIHIKNLELPAGFNKTVTFTSSAISICVADAALEGFANVTSDCTGSDEGLFTQSACTSGTSAIIGGHTVICSYGSGKYTLSGLRNTIVTEGNARLEISDNVSGQTDINVPVQFIANYTNNSNGAAISGATCTIKIDGRSSQSMSASGDLYVYNYAGFSTEGTKSYNVTCSKTGFNTLTGVETLIVGDVAVIPEFEDYALMAAILGSVMIAGYVRRREIEVN